MSARVVAITGYLVLLALAVVLALLARRREPSVTRFSGFVAAVVRRPVGRAAVLLAWWWLGWHFFVR